MTQRYHVIVADPPWRFGDPLPGKKRGAAKHYSTLSTAEIMRFPLPEMTRDAALFLWRVSAMQQEALDVIRAWGFEQKSEIVWRKMKPSGRVHFGMGRTVRASHETCLIATRGRPTVLSRRERSVFDAVVGEHSAKPDEFYEIVERMFSGPYVELFARRHRAGWECFGDQLPEETQ